MSVLNKIPYISALIGSMSAEELTTLTNLMNGSGNRAPLRRTVNPIDDASCPHITSDDKGVHMCSLTCNYTNFTGYLVYTDDYCALLSFTDSIVLKVFDIDVTNVGIRTIDEAITVLELRSVVWQEIHKNDGESGTVVVANPELVGTESDLTGLQVGNTKYKVPQPTTVEANPTLDGTESALTGLKVGSTKYKVSGGTKLYKHELSFSDTTLGITIKKISIITNNNTLFTTSTVYGNVKIINITGDVISFNNSRDALLTVNSIIYNNFWLAEVSKQNGYYQIAGIAYNNDGTISSLYSNILSLGTFTLEDTVTEL